MKTLKVEPIIKFTLLLLLGLGSGAGNHAYAQELRDLFRQVKASVVTAPTTEREIKPQSKGEFVKTTGIGSGVLISADGKVMTAAHIVKAADDVNNLWAWQVESRRHNNDWFSTLLNRRFEHPQLLFGLIVKYVLRGETTMR